MAAKMNTENLLQYQNRPFLIVEQLLDFTNVVREVKNMSSKCVTRFIAKF